MMLDVTDAEMAYVVEGGTQSDGVGHVGRASLKTSRRHIVLRALDGHVLNHITTTLPGLHLIEQVLTTIHHSDTVGAIDFVA